MFESAKFAVAAVAVAAGSLTAAPPPAAPIPSLEVAQTKGITIVVNGGAVDTDALLVEARKFCAPGAARLVEKTPREGGFAVRFVCDKAD